MIKVVFLLTINKLINYHSHSKIMKSILRSAQYFFLFVALSYFVTSCNDDTTNDPLADKLVANYDNSVAVAWNELFLDVERYASGYRPGPAPRALSILGLSAYEACVSGMPDFNSLQNEIPGLVVPKISRGLEYHWPTVINASYGYLMPKFFVDVRPDLFVKLDQLKTKHENIYSGQVNTVVFERSKAHGEAVAAAIWEWSKTDTYGHDAYKDPFKGYDWKAAYKKPGDWKPSDEVNGKAMFANWGKVRSYTLNTEDKLTCRKQSAPYSEVVGSAYYTQAAEVMTHNTPTQPYESEWIGEFWSDDLTNLTFSPPARWIAIATQVYVNEKCSLETAVYANAKVGLSINDAGVGCWYSKYKYNLERPYTYIRKFIKPDWETNLSDPNTNTNNITPSFPAYPSGHATFSGAGAEALSSIFGYDYAMTDNCHKNRTEFEGKPRTFSSFYEMADENGFSRIPLGVHWRMDAEEGVRFGKEIGRRVSNLPWKK